MRMVFVAVVVLAREGIVRDYGYNTTKYGNTAMVAQSGWI
jgi:hypothetical protein